MSENSVPSLAHFAPLAARADLLLCDVWGVIHNGLAAWPAACDALTRFRDTGGSVVLVTNAPRPNESVAQQLDLLAVPRNAYDAILSSGDVSRTAIARHGARPLFHLGPQRDMPLFEGLQPHFVGAEAAELVVCTGLFDDEHETPDDYAAMLAALQARRVPMICANPDLVVQRGDQLVYCAGALAERYHAIGGEVLFAGKPHRPIYEQALAVAEQKRGAAIAHERILAIGDSVRTDLHGAANFGIPCLFIAGGIHAHDFKAKGAKAAAGRDGEPQPLAIMDALRW